MVNLINKYGIVPVLGSVLCGLASCQMLGLQQEEEDQTPLLALAYLATKKSDSSSTPTPTGSCQATGNGALCEAIYNNSKSTSDLTTYCTNTYGGGSVFTASAACTTTSLLGTCKFATKETASGGPGGGGTTVSYKYSGNAETLCAADGGTFSTGVQYP